MNTIERVRELLKDEVVENVVDSRFLCGGVADVVCVQDVELLLNSLSQERCVWEEKPDPDFDGAHYYETQCGLLMDDETAYGWFQGDTSHWGHCRCGKRIEVKEADNG